MSIADALLPEFDHETAVTRALLERVPAERHDWKPHGRSYSLGELSMHLANIPVWMSITLERREFDLNRVDASRPQAPSFESLPQLLRVFDGNVAAARAVLARTSDAEFAVPWTLKSGGKTMFSMPRAAVVRSFVMNHAVHHRGQLSVYLRLLDVALPNIYGPTADS